MKIKLPTISPAVRVSFGLVMFTLSVLLIADLFGVIPKKNEMVLDARKKVCESLAVQLSVAASSQEGHIVKATLESFVERNPDVVAAALTKETGGVLAQYGNFTDIGEEDASAEKSQENQVFIPIYSGMDRWGTVNVEFTPVYKKGLWAFMTETIFGMMAFVAIGCIIGYIFILRKALHVLDPKAVVPERVRTAFNTLSEGVLILDNNEQIMMANDAFTEQVEKAPEQLVGAKVSSLKWKIRKHEEDKHLPWIHSIEGGEKKIGVPLDLSTPKKGVRAMSTNSAPILDESGKTRGALVTFDDVTEVEESNVLLENAVDSLQKNDAEIRRKNKELEVLATRDPLTGCYNRRAFFDLVEDMFQHASSSNTDLCYIMVDIDHFKSINDRFGHAIGDEAIRMVADILNDCPHKGVVVGRYGGEEFCLALPNVDLEGAQKIAEELRNKIRLSSHDFCGVQVVITASFGVSSIESGVKDNSKLLELADTALYAAKNSGRDRVIAWNDQLDKDGDANANQSEEDSTVDQINQKRNDIQLIHMKRRIDELEHELDKKAAESLHDQFKDPITDLPTRIIFEDRVSQSMAYSTRAKTVMAVAIFNIDMFSRINNTLGRVVGDEFLKAVGQRLKTILRRSDTVASMIAPGQAGPSLSRLHDDEFALLLTGLQDVESLTYVIKRIQDKFSGKIDVSGNEMFVTTTIGLALYPDDGATPTTLIENARSAQKHAKSQVGRNTYQFYSQEINRKIVKQMKLELDMHKAVENNEFSMLYQPKLDLNTGTIDSLEALIRWNHPEQGVITPGEFIPAAEKSGLVVDIGYWCLQQVCAQTRKWVDQGASDLRVSVNISAIEFVEEDFVDKITAILKDAGLPAHHLELEVTETTVMTDLTMSSKIIDDLRFRGITVTLDDFGTGYSSFNYLGHLNLDWIKIDKSFLMDAMKHRRSRTLYSGIVTMAQSIGLKVVSEGIETQQEYNYVKKLGIDEMQGYMLSKPLDVEAATRTLFNKSTQAKKAV